MERDRLKHSIEPVFDGRSRVLLLGTFPSPKSREAGFFYGHPQNRMWRVLTAVMGEPEAPRSVDERRAFLLRNRIAMWDVIARCTIEGASDASIKDVVPNDLSCVLDAAPIRAVFCTGAKAHELYRRWQEPVTGIPATRLPSTSAANAAWSLERLTEAYRIVAETARD